MKKIFASACFLLLTIILSFVQIQAEDFWQRTNGPKGGIIRSTAINSRGEIFAIIGYYKVYKSVDYGDTWEFVIEPSYPSSYFSDIRIDKHDKIYLLGGDWTSLKISNDNGKSWIFKDCPAGYPTMFQVSDNGCLFVNSDWFGLCVSSDSGGTWTHINNFNSYLRNCREIVFDSDNNAYAVFDKGGIFKASYPYQEWTILPEFNDWKEYSPRALSINNNDVLVAASHDNPYNCIHISYNRGVNWSKHDSIRLPSSIYSSLITDDLKIIVGYCFGIYRSLDTCKTLTKVNNPNRNAEISNLFSYSNDTLFGYNYNGDFFRSYTGGADWEEIIMDAGFKIVKAICFDSNQVLYAASERQDIFYSPDYGNSWVKDTSPVFSFYLDNNKNRIYSRDTIDINFMIPKIMVCNNEGDIVVAGSTIGGSGVFYKKKGSNKWIRTPKFSGITTATNIGLGIDSNEFYFCNGKIAKYNFKDDTYRYLNIPKGTVISIAIFKNGYLGIAVKGSGFYLSKDDGYSFKKMEFGLYQYELDNTLYCFKTENDLLYSFSSQSILFSSDYGESWSLIYHFDKKESLNPPFYVSDNGYIFSRDYYSSNGGKTFETDGYRYRYNYMPGKYCITLGPDGYVYTGTNEGIYRSVNKIITTVEYQELGSDRLAIYPNPATNIINVNYSDNMYAEQIKIFNLLGFPLWSGIADGESKTIDVSHLPAGVYFLRAGKEIKMFVKK